MITGSTASSIQGEPRSTHDIDLVVELGAEAVEGPAASFPEPDFHLSAGGSERQERDALAVYELQFTRLDQNYLDEWARRLGVADLLERLRAEAEPLE